MEVNQLLLSQALYNSPTYIPVGPNEDLTKIKAYTDELKRLRKNQGLLTAMVNMRLGLGGDKTTEESCQEKIIEESLQFLKKNKNPSLDWIKKQNLGTLDIILKKPIELRDTDSYVATEHLCIRVAENVLANSIDNLLNSNETFKSFIKDALLEPNRLSVDTCHKRFNCYDRNGKIKKHGSTGKIDPKKPLVDLVMNSAQKATNICQFIILPDRVALIFTAKGQHRLFDPRPRTYYRSSQIETAIGPTIFAGALNQLCAFVQPHIERGSKILRISK